MDATLDDIKNRIKKFLCETFRVDQAGIGDASDLFASGIIDSLSAAEVVLFLEREFQVRFEREQLFDQRFISVQGMAEIISEMKRRIKPVDR